MKYRRSKLGSILYQGIRHQETLSLVMSELRQRRRKNTPSVVEAAPELNVSKIPHKSSYDASAKKKCLSILMVCFCFVN